MAKTMVQKCFAEIGKQFDGIEKSLRRNYLPYDAELEYIEFTGTQYINTGIDVYDTDKAEVGVIATFTIGSGTSEACIVGTQANTFWFPIMFNYGNGPYQYFAGNKVTLNNGYIKDNRYDIISEYDSNGTKITLSINNGTTIEKTASGMTPTHSNYPLLVMGGIYANSPYQLAKGKLLYCRFFKNDVLIYDAIPVRRGQTGYIYDKVSDQLFGNAGIGYPWILGADKS